MLKSIKIIACGLTLAMGAGGLASAGSGAATPVAPKAAEASLEKTVQRRTAPARRHYRDRRGYRDQRRDYRGNQRAASRCWNENHRSRFRGQPALVSVRVCRDHNGRAHTVRGSARLIRYLRGPRGRW